MGDSFLTLVPSALFIVGVPRSLYKSIISKIIDSLASKVNVVYDGGNVENT